MSQWNAIIQSLHSSLIDELNARLPFEKLELGLPKRFSGWTLLDEATQAVHLPIELESGAGMCMLAGGKNQRLADLETILLATVKRAQSEFKRRQIAPQFLGAVQAPRPEQPRSLKAPSLLIFFPIRVRPDDLDSLIFDLGVGV